MPWFAAADGYENLAAHFPIPSPSLAKTTAAYIRKKPDIGAPLSISISTLRLTSSA